MNMKSSSKRGILRGAQKKISGIPSKVRKRSVGLESKAKNLDTKIEQRISMRFKNEAIGVIYIADFVCAACSRSKEDYPHIDGILLII